MSWTRFDILLPIEIDDLAWHDVAELAHDIAFRHGGDAHIVTTTLPTWEDHFPPSVATPAGEALLEAATRLVHQLHGSLGGPAPSDQDLRVAQAVLALAAQSTVGAGTAAVDAAAVERQRCIDGLRNVANDLRRSSIRTSTEYVANGVGQAIAHLSSPAFVAAGQLAQSAVPDQTPAP